MIRLAYLLLIVLLILWAEALSGETRFRWAANPASDNVTGYTLYRDGDFVLTTQQTTATVETEPGESYTLTASNVIGESDPTAPIIITASLAPPLDMTGTTIHAVSSEETPKHAAINILDGNAATFWHTRWSDGGALGPHYVAIKLPRKALASVLYYLPRGDIHTNGIIENYEVETSLDGIQWTEVATGTWAKDHSEKHAQLIYGQARYIRLWSKDNAATATSLAIGGTWVPEPPATVTVTLQESADLAEWSDLSETTLPKKDRQFFRLKLETP